MPTRPPLPALTPPLVKPAPVPTWVAHAAKVRVAPNAPPTQPNPEPDTTQREKPHREAPGVEHARRAAAREAARWLPGTRPQETKP